MVLRALTLAVKSSWRTLTGRAAEVTLAQVVNDNFAGMVVVDAGGAIIAASRIACHLLNNGEPLEGTLIKSSLPLDMRRAVE